MAATGQQHEAGQAKGAAAPGLRGWITAHRLVSAVAAVLIFGVAPLAGLWLLTPAARQEGPITLADALAALDHGELESARSLAERLIDAGALTEDELGGPAFVLGAVASQQADAMWEDARVKMSLLAARHLEDSQDLGFPAQREAEGLWLLGKNLFRGGRLEASQQPLEAAIPLNASQASGIHRMLTDAYQAGETPKLSEALRHSRLYLADPALYIEDRQQGLLEQAKILFLQKDFVGCREVIGQISTKAPEYSEALLLEGRMAMAEAVPDSSASADLGSAVLGEEARRRLESALATFERARTSGAAKDRVAARAAYLMGLCHEMLGDRPAALKHFGEAGDSSRPASMAAMVHAAALLLADGRDEEAVAAFGSMLSKVESAGDDVNPWLSRDELHRRAMEAYLTLVEAQKYELSLALIENFYPAFPRTRQLQLLAQTHRAWATSLREESLEEAADKTQLRGQRESQFRQAGHAYRQLAELRFAEREYPDDLWDCIECYSASHDYAAAIDVLRNYLKHEPVRRRAAALQRLGEALLVEGRVDEAAAALDESVEFDPRNAASYSSKILASKAMIDAGDLEAAQALLMENLESEFLTPASIEWRETLFQLGRLLHLQGNHGEAIKRLEEAVARYPDDAHATLARYLIADSYRQLAKDRMAGLESVVVESARIGQTREAHRLLDAAIVQFDLAMAALESSIERGAAELSAADAAMLRNCHFMKGAALFDQGKYEEAIRAYSSATNRYQHEPEVLDAYVKVADCYRRLNRPTEARGTIEQAKVVLSRMPADLDFQEQTNFDRQEWARHLEWLGTL